VNKEIAEKRQWKIMVGDSIACVFATTFNDPFIWQEKDKEPSVYIHRIATDPRHRGNNFVIEIVRWARTYAKENGKSFYKIRHCGGKQRTDKLLSEMWL
jgi:hypothetical protein